MDYTKPTDEQIIDALKGRYGTMTYVLRNILTGFGRPLPPTAFIRRRLFALEKAGKVKRVQTSYAVQHCWALAYETE